MESENLPKHIAIIMDGNRRWARERGIAPLKSHEYGYESFRAITEEVFRKGIEYLTVYAFSTENWKRSGGEVAFLMDLFARALRERSGYLNERHIRIRFIGDRSRLSHSLRIQMEQMEQQTRDFVRGTLIIALNYGGRDEIISAVKRIAASGIDPNAVTHDVFSSHLSTAGIPDPDLIIRTSGEYRLSGFLPWQGVYSELYFTEKYWPEFDVAELEIALNEFQSRKRRYGA